MTNIKVLVWKNSEPAGEPDVEVKIPASLAKWVPRLMVFVPKKTREELWEKNVDFGAIFANIEQLITEAAKNGIGEVADVKTKESHVKVLVEA